MAEPIKITSKNVREAVYLSLLKCVKEELFLADILEKWRVEVGPLPEDFALAREISYGTMRRALSLDHLATRLTDKEKLNLKQRERLLLRSAIYQFYFMDRIPIYAIVDETVEIAKKHCHETFVKFLNAVLRRMPDQKLELPQGMTVPDMSIRYSYPAFYVEELIQNYGPERAEQILEAGNCPSQTMFRIRPQAAGTMEKMEGIELITGTVAPIGVLKDIKLLAKIAQSDEVYIQNITPAELIHRLAKDFQTPERILDLCSSPGGKLVAVHDLYPESELFANDVSPDKLQPLSDNCAKYHLSATLTISKGEEYRADKPFDLIVIDAPCSNSGVFNKRPEARWRLDEASLAHMEELQLKLIGHAQEMLAENGEIWFMTCSVLKRENARLVKKACHDFGLKIRVSELILPNEDGWDGGFACALQPV